MVEWLLDPLMRFFHWTRLRLEKPELSLSCRLVPAFPTPDHLEFFAILRVTNTTSDDVVLRSIELEGPDGNVFAHAFGPGLDLPMRLEPQDERLMETDFRFDQEFRARGLQEGVHLRAVIETTLGKVIRSAPASWEAVDGGLRSAPPTA